MEIQVLSTLFLGAKHPVLHVLIVIYTELEKVADLLCVHDAFCLPKHGRNPFYRTFKHLLMMTEPDTAPPHTPRYFLLELVGSTVRQIEAGQRL